MEKMFLVPSDQYEVMASGQKKMNTDGKTEAADVQMARLQSDQIQSEERNKLREQKSQEDFVKKIKPLLESNRVDLMEILKKFSEDKKGLASTILNMLSRFPMVSLSNERVTIDGQAMSQPLFDIINDIIKNGVTGVESAINALRGVKKNWKPRAKSKTLHPTFKAIAKSTPKKDEDFSKSMKPYLSGLEYLAPTPSPQKSSHPKLRMSLSPEVKTRNKRREEEGDQKKKLSRSLVYQKRRIKTVKEEEEKDHDGNGRVQPRGFQPGAWHIY